ncbi:MAG: uridine diphosphate-N-acetylglucosamine-binding protein YvcK [Acidimicrobiales bacterium]
MTRVVALGGGHGLAATLAAARRYADDVCAIVSVADDGGSSGRLRADFGIPPPGDLRKCLVALAPEGSLWAGAFEHRFSAGDLEGHAFGNLVIAGLADATGDFEGAVAEAGRLLGAVGRVLPATREPVVLKATIGAGPAAPGGPGGPGGVVAPGGPGSSGGERGSVSGQVAVANAGPIASVSLVPADPEPPAEALAALAAADQVVIGPGSLYTSVLAVVAVPALRDALATTPGRKVYVCNLREQPPETAGYDVADHVAALSAHGLDVDTVLYHPGALPVGRPTVRCVEQLVARPGGSAHDPVRLAAALEALVG